MDLSCRGWWSPLATKDRRSPMCAAGFWLPATLATFGFIWESNNSGHWTYVSWGFLSLIIRADSERWLPHLVTSSHFKPFETRESIGTIPKRMEYRKPTKTKPPATKTSLPCRNCSQAWRHSGREVSRFWETSAKSCLAANHQRI